MLVAGRRAWGETRAIVTSLNPADGSANHSNIGLLVDGAVARYAARSEMAVAAWSSRNAGNVYGGLNVELSDTLKQLHLLISKPQDSEMAIEKQASVAWRSEGAIRKELIAQLNKTERGSRIDLAIFYFSDRRMVKALKAAINRGAEVRLLMDVNRDAFGRKKNGVPNRPVAAELMELREFAGNITVRWANTHGEQFHSKALRIIGVKQDILFLGSANWTRRNLGNLNLEANLLLEQSGEVGLKFDVYFQSLWDNSQGLEESVPYTTWREKGWRLLMKKYLYRLQEWGGSSIF